MVLTCKSVNKSGHRGERLIEPLLLVVERYVF